MTADRDSPYQYVGSELDVFSLAVNWKAYAADLLREHLRGDVLEVGGGIGTTARALLHPGVRSWTAVEPDAALARRFVQALGRWEGAVRPRVVVGTIADIPASERFDSILYFDVLEHIEDDRAEATRAAEHLRRAGRLIVVSPAFNLVYSDFDRAIGHVRRYSARSLMAVMPPDLIRRAVFYADSVGLVLNLGNRLLLRQGQPRPGQIRFWDRRVIPISRVADRLLRRLFGRSVIAVYERPS